MPRVDRINAPIDYLAAAEHAKRRFRNAAASRALRERVSSLAAYVVDFVGYVFHRPPPLHHEYSPVNHINYIFLRHEKAVTL